MQVIRFWSFSRTGLLVHPGGWPTFSGQNLDVWKYVGIMGKEASFKIFFQLLNPRFFSRVLFICTMRLKRHPHIQKHINPQHVLCPRMDYGMKPLLTLMWRHYTKIDMTRMCSVCMNTSRLSVSQLMARYPCMYRQYYITSLYVELLEKEKEAEKKRAWN